MYVCMYRGGKWEEEGSIENFPFEHLCINFNTNRVQE